MSLRKIEKFLLGATLFCIPFETGALYNQVVKTDLITATDVMLWSLYLLWMYRTNLFTSERLRFGKVAVWAILMIIWSFLSMTSAIAIQATGLGIYMWIKAFLLYFYLVNNIKTKKQLFFVVNMLVFSVLFQGALGVAQSILGRSVGLDFLGEKQMSFQKEVSRVRGTLGYPNRYGAVMIMLLPLAVSMAVFAKRSFYKWILIAASSFGMMGLFLSLSRSSWGGFLLGMMVFTVILFRRGLLKPKYIVALAVVFVAVIVIAASNWEKIEARFQTGADGRWRVKMIDIALPIIEEYPVFGVGLNNYQWHSYDQFKFWHPVHNEFLRFAAELGVPGCIFFILLIWVFLREAYRNIMLKDAMINAVAIGILCGLIAFIVAINIGPEYQHYRIKQTFWALAGITFALTRIKYLEIKTLKKRKQMQEAKERANRASVPVPDTIPHNGVLTNPPVRRL